MPVFNTRRCADFVEYRGAVRDSTGLTLELSEIEPISEEWIHRMERVHRGLDASGGGTGTVRLPYGITRGVRRTVATTGYGTVLYGTVRYEQGTVQ